MNLLLLLIATATAGVEAPGGRFVADTRSFSVIALDEHEIFDRQPPRPGMELHRPENVLSVELGATSSMGNVGTSVIYSRFYAAHRWRWNRLSIKGRGEYGRSLIDANGDGTLDDPERDVGFQRTSQRFQVDGRYDKFFGPLNSVYLLAGWMNNPFSGYVERIHGQSGYSRFLVAQKEHEVVGETGVDVARERYVPEVVPHEDIVYAARAFMGWTTTVSDTFQVLESVESFVNVENPDDVRVIGEIALTMKANNLLSVKTSYLIEHDTTPIEGFRETDQIMALTLMASVFRRNSS